MSVQVSKWNADQINIWGPLFICLTNSMAITLYFVNRIAEMHPPEDIEGLVKIQDIWYKEYESVLNSWSSVKR